MKQTLKIEIKLIQTNLMQLLFQPPRFFRKCENIVSMNKNLITINRMHA